MKIEQENKENYRTFQWQPFVELVVILLTIVGTVVPLYIHTDSKLHTALAEINKEMKDFHGKLCIIEASKKG